MLRFIVVAVILFGFLGGSIGRLHRLKELSKSKRRACGLSGKCSG